MSNLSNSIFTYYVQNLHRLPAYKQFHFASRMYLWDQKPGMQPILSTLQPWFTADGDTTAALLQVQQLAAKEPDYGSKNTLHLRQPYFGRYPKLTDYIPVLLWTMYLRTVYNLDCRDTFAKLFPTNEVNECAMRLLADDTAIAMLSSQAINFLYTWAQLNDGNEAQLSPERFLSVGQAAYNHSNKLHLQLLMYLYTHCIIGATHFYHRGIPIKQREPYNAMMRELETILEDYYQDINLDNKFEFLVCAAILDYPTKSLERITEEAEHSLAKKGHFLIDRHNTNPQSNNEGFERSEHRNTLFILGNSPYHPLG